MADTPVDAFERRVILTVARAMYLLLGGLAALGLVGSIVIYAYGASPTWRSSDPPEPEPVKPPAITVADITAVLDGKETPGRASTAPDGFGGAEGEGEEVPPALARLQELHATIQASFDSSRYPWLSETQTYCKYRGYRGCAQWDTRVVRKGAADMLRAHVDGRSFDESVPTFEAAATLLPSCPDDDTRFVALGATLDMVAAAGGHQTGPHERLRDAVGRTAGDPQKLTEVLQAILKARKAGAEPDVLAAWIGKLPDLRDAFGTLEDGRSNVADGLQATWLALQGLPPSVIDAQLADIARIAPAVELAERPRAVRVLGDLARERVADAQRAYEQAMSERAAAVLANDTSYTEALARKMAAKATALTSAMSALGFMAVIGLFLALLAVERNTRALRELLERMPRPESERA